MAAENAASVQTLCFPPVAYFWKQMYFLGLELVVTLKAAELLQFQWKSLEVKSFAGFKLMKVLRVVQHLNLFEQSLDAYIDPERHAFQIRA